MSEVEIAGLVFMAVIVALLTGAYYLGKADAKKGRQKLYNDLVTERAVRHNLNCLVGDLRHECKQYKPDALAFRAIKGNWMTDNKELVAHSQRKECFRRIGYMGERL